jgi:hypothetical protein
MMMMIDPRRYWGNVPGQINRYDGDEADEVNRVRITPQERLEEIKQAREFSD